MNPEFIQVASLLGRSLAALENSQEVTSYSRIPDPQQFRKIMSRGTDLSRCRRGKTFFDAIGYRTRIGQGMHDRGEAYVFADADLCDADRRGLSNHFPVRLKSISVARKRLRAGQVWDVSTCGEDWGVDALEELYVLLNVGRLEVEPGAAILVQGNVFSFVFVTERILTENPAKMASTASPVRTAMTCSYLRAFWALASFLKTPINVATDNGEVTVRTGAPGSVGATVG